MLEKISLIELKTRLHYHRRTGVFTWIKPCGTRFKKGDVAGRLCTTGHRQIQIARRRYMAGALAWFYVTGAWPTLDIDHRDGFPDHNWWSNLRQATEAQNISNSKRRKDNTSGYKGVSWNQIQKKWQVSIAHEKRKIHLGFYKEAAEGHAAYCKAAFALKGEFARVA